MNSSLQDEHPFAHLPWDSECDWNDRNRHHTSESTFSRSMNDDQRILVKHSSEPIRFKHVKSNSEIQREERERVADYRDYCMVRRIVTARSRRELASPKSLLDPNVVDMNRSCELQLTMPESFLKEHEHIDLDDKLSTPYLLSTYHNILVSRSLPPQMHPAAESALLPKVLSRESIICDNVTVDDENCSRDDSCDEMFEFDP